MNPAFLKRHRAILSLWLAWVVALSLFQSYVVARLPARPVDRALPWTAAETGVDLRSVKARLSTPFLSERVAWDSEFYLSIAIAGYDDPAVRKVAIPGSGAFSLNYAFLPGYPIAIRVAMAPFRAFGMSASGAAVIAGIVVSTIASLFAALALARLARGSWGGFRQGGMLRDSRAISADEATRAAWFMLIFPSGFFLAQVYTEALFLSFALWAIVFAREGKWTAAAIVASCAVLTRAAGVALVPAIALVAAARLIREWRISEDLGQAPQEPRSPDGAMTNKTASTFFERLVMAEAILVPLAVFAVWKLSVLGTRFDVVERAFFGRALDPVASIGSWLSAFASIVAGKGDRSAYYALELASFVAVIASAAWGLRRHPDLAVFGLTTFALSFFSYVPQGLVRYALSSPLVFIAAARLTRKKECERGYELASVLLMGLLAALFSLDMWVG